MQEHTITFESGNLLLKLLQGMRTDLRNVNNKHVAEAQGKLTAAIRIVIGEDNDISQA